MPETTDPALLQRLKDLFDARDRDDMEPTIAALRAVLAEHPTDPHVLYEVGGAYDTAGEEETAAGYYERALDAGLAGDTLRRCLLQYGSTLRNLGRFDESLAVLDRARELFPESESVLVWHALSLHAAGRSDGAVAELMELAADRIRTPDLLRYEAAIRGNAEYLLSLDGER
ncbi:MULTISPECIES: tetratricopeptide repeat protein [unclassified Leifsonia]|uniref:tetratricopeptide repeat protein n=1 Tax=unclassified Leifsonia TaxID=2663824 RepID=UPI0003629E66|nr:MULTISPECIES: tetratricopeptide repeat protein [unclassified Leifsonia]TDP98378.1 tetratricopeptide repeat protein [Leifsonia sp. 115AMFTsu3.1]